MRSRGAQVAHLADAAHRIGENAYDASKSHHAIVLSNLAIAEALLAVADAIRGTREEDNK